MIHPVPAPDYRMTKGRIPRTGTAKLSVQFRNGQIGGPYTAKQIVWEDRGHSWDAVAVKRV